MGIMRALSLKRPSIIPTRNKTSKGRPQISLPSELISTTNNLAYTSPSVESMQQKSGHLSDANSPVICELVISTTTNSETVQQEHIQCPQTPSTVSDASSRRSSRLSTRSGTGSGSAPSLTDASSVSSSPITPFSLPNLLSAPSSSISYFHADSFSKASSRRSSTSFLDDSDIDPLTVVVPALPRRAASHSKREHERLARRRSQRASMKPIALPSATLDVAQDVLSPAPLSAAAAVITMPELREVDEDVVPSVTVVDVAEEYKMLEECKTLEEMLKEMVTEDDEACYMRERGLKRFSVGGYLDVVDDVWAKELLMIDGGAVVVV